MALKSGYDETEVDRAELKRWVRLERDNAYHIGPSPAKCEQRTKKVISHKDAMIR